MPLSRVAIVPLALLVLAAAYIVYVVIYVYLQLDEFGHKYVPKLSLAEYLKANNASSMLELPLSCFHVNSSHNSYLSGNQIGGFAKAQNIRSCLNLGARCIEIDIHKFGNVFKDSVVQQQNGLNPSTPVVMHGNDKIVDYDYTGLGNVLQMVKENAFAHTDDPLIVYFEIFDAEDEKMMIELADTIKKYLGDRLYPHSMDQVFVNPSKYFIHVPIRQLLGKICIVVNYFGMTKGLGNRDKYLFPIIHGTADEPDSGWIKDPLYPARLSGQGAADPPVNKALQVARVYPNNVVLSDNYDPEIFWNNGYTFVSLNFQTNDKHLKKNMKKFASANIIPKRLVLDSH